MATIAFTWNWKVSCRRDSLIDLDWYAVDLATGVDKNVATQLAVELKRLNYIDVTITLQHSIP